MSCSPVSSTWLALSIRWTMGSRICPLLWQNCSMTAADSLAARVTIWYVFFTAVGSFSDLVWQPDSIETGATAAYQPSTKSGAQSHEQRVHTPRLGPGRAEQAEAPAQCGRFDMEMSWVVHLRWPAFTWYQSTNRRSQN